MKGLVIFLVFLLLAFPAFAITEYSKTIWNDIYITPYSYPSSAYQFFSLYQYNLSRFFVLYPQSTQSICLDRYVEYGYREDSKCGFLSVSCSACQYYMPSDPIIWSIDRIVTLVNSYFSGKSYIDFCELNITKYFNNMYDFIICRPTGIIDVSSPKPIEVSAPFFKSNFPSFADPGIYSNVTFAFSNGAVVYYDFYDFDSGSYDWSRVKSIDFSSGLSDVRKSYPIVTQCFYNSLCHPVHLIFEGRSIQNNNRYGIYIRETWVDPFGLRDFKDIGLIGFNDSIGFRTSANVISWFYSIYTNLFYVKVQDQERRPWFIYEFYPVSWTIRYTDAINFYDNNLLVNYARTIGSFSVTGNGCFWVNNTVFKSISNKTYISGTVTTPNVYYLNFNLYLYLYDNTTNQLVYSSYQSLPVGTNVPFLFIVDLGNTSYYNLEICHNVPVYPYGETVTYNVYNDIVGSNSIVRATPTGGIGGLVESFAIYPIGEGIANFSFQIPSSVTCYCTSFTRVGCVNTTHSLWTRTCYPSGCSFEQYYLADAECYNYTATTTTTTTTTIPSSIPGIPPGVGYTGGLFNLTGKAIELNITGGALVGIAILDRILSLAGIATFITIAVGAALGYITKNGHVAAIAILLLIIFFTLIGFYPWWFGIVFIIIAGLIVTLMFKGAF
jgi:hypothetical protein